MSLHASLPLLHAYEPLPGYPCYACDASGKQTVDSSTTITNDKLIFIRECDCTHSSVTYFMRSHAFWQHTSDPEFFLVAERAPKLQLVQTRLSQWLQVVSRLAPMHILVQSRQQWVCTLVPLSCRTPNTSNRRKELCNAPIPCLFLSLYVLQFASKK